VLRLKKEVVVALEIHHGLDSRIDVLLVNAECWNRIELEDLFVAD
jgi:hypothetical protein